MIAVDNRPKNGADDDPDLRELRNLLVNIQRFVPDDEPIPFRPPNVRRIEGATSASSRPALKVRAEGGGSEDRLRVGHDSNQNFRELKRLLVNIQRFIPEEEPQEDLASNVKRLTSAAPSRPLKSTPLRSDEPKAPVVREYRSLQLHSSALSGKNLPMEQQQRARLSISPTAFVVSVLGFAVVLAGLVGVIVVGTTRSVMLPRQSSETRGPSSNATALDVSMPKQIQAVAGLPVNLPIRLLPAGIRRGALLLLLRGLPVEASLSGATRLGAQTWLIDGDKDLALDLTLPSSTQGPLAMEILVRSPSGADLGWTRTSLALRPTAPEAASKQPDPTLAQRLLENGRHFLTAGEVDAARLLLQRSAQLGNAQAALELGATFDPATMSAVGVRGRAGDEQKAIVWYSEAKRLGSTEAEGRLNGLGNK